MSRIPQTPLGQRCRATLVRMLFAATLASALCACTAGDVDQTQPSNTPVATSAPSASSTSTDPDPTTSTGTSDTAETRSKQAQRLASEQLAAYYAAGDELYGDSSIPLAVLNDFARDSALANKKESIQARRDLGERTEGTTTIVRTWLGEDGVAFNKSAPRAVVDLYVCYDISDIEIVDANGNRTPAAGPGVPAVAQARYAIYADQWPNDTATAWRIGREFASGEECQQ